MAYYLLVQWPDVLSRWQHDVGVLCLRAAKADGI